MPACLVVQIFFDQKPVPARPVFTVIGYGLLLLRTADLSVIKKG